MSEQKRIRLTLHECQLIRAGLRNLDLLPRTKEGIKGWDAERLKDYILKNFIIPEDQSGLIYLSSRFFALSEDDGYYARSPRGSRSQKK